MILNRQRLFPVRPIAVLDENRDGRANGFPLPHAGEKLGGVRFDFHPPAAPVAALAPLEVAVDRLKIHRQARRQTLDNRHQRLAVRLPCGVETKHLEWTALDSGLPAAGRFALSKQIIDEAS